jgi:hypothetical protein
MFLGHFALAFAAKKAVPAVSLGALFLACQFADLLWPFLVLLGIERVRVQPGATAMTPLDFVSYPYSHSLIALAGWGIVVGGTYQAATRSRVFAGVILGLLVVSHWVLDVVTHRPDMPLTITGATRLGLGLWNSVPAALTVELLVFAAGIALYRQATVARDRIGSVGLWSLAVFLAVVYFASAFGPPPPDARTVAWSAMAMWLLVVWGHWVDTHRYRTRSFGGRG